MSLEQTHPYHVAINDQQITIHADRALFDAVALTKLLDYLSQESNDRRHQPVQPEADAEQVALQKEVAAYHAMHPTLLAEHAGEWVAVYQGALIDFDGNQDALMTRLDRQHPMKSVLVRHIEAEPERELSAPSFRLVPA